MAKSIEGCSVDPSNARDKRTHRALSSWVSGQHPSRLISLRPYSGGVDDHHTRQRWPTVSNLLPSSPRPFLVHSRKPIVSQAIPTVPSVTVRRLVTSAKRSNVPTQNAPEEDVSSYFYGRDSQDLAQRPEFLGREEYNTHDFIMVLTLAKPDAGGTRAETVDAGHLQCLLQVKPPGTY